MKMNKKARFQNNVYVEVVAESIAIKAQRQVQGIPGTSPCDAKYCTER